jgi:cytochrome P450
LVAFVILLLLAGNETTTNLLGNGTLALLSNPEQYALLRENRALLPRAIEEMLRYDPPAQSTVRLPRVDTVVSGVEIKAQTPVFVVVAAANRDPAQFSDPERFVITREPNDHLSFGHGIHYCLGAALARLEAAVAFGALLERFPRLRFANPQPELTYKGSYFLRGLAELHLEIS